LLEILLVVAAIAVLAGIVIVAINPARQLAETRDAQRRSDIQAISSAIAQHVIKTGSYPEELLSGAESCAEMEWNSEDYGICEPSAECEGIMLEDSLVPTYMPNIPLDPNAQDDGFSGYTATVLSNQRVLVCAPFTEDDDIVISATR
jgi:type IV pilus assembly protein PilA